MRGTVVGIGDTVGSKIRRCPCSRGAHSSMKKAGINQLRSESNARLKHGLGNTVSAYSKGLDLFREVKDGFLEGSDMVGTEDGWNMHKEEGGRTFQKGGHMCSVGGNMVTQGPTGNQCGRRGQRGG